MINQAHERRTRSCYAKRRYCDEFAARAVGMELVEEGKHESMSVYHCQVCGGWHLTTKQNGKQANVFRYVRGNFK